MTKSGCLSQSGSAPDIFALFIAEPGQRIDYAFVAVLFAIIGVILEGLHARKVEGFACFAREFRRSEEHTSELQSLMRISYAVFCLKKKNTPNYKTFANLHILIP